MHIQPPTIPTQVSQPTILPVSSSVGPRNSDDDGFRVGDATTEDEDGGVVATTVFRVDDLRSDLHTLEGPAIDVGSRRTLDGKWEVRTIGAPARPTLLGAQRAIVRTEQIRSSKSLDLSDQEFTRPSRHHRPVEKTVLVPLPLIERCPFVALVSRSGIEVVAAPAVDGPEVGRRGRDRLRCIATTKPNKEDQGARTKPNHGGFRGRTRRSVRAVHKREDPRWQITRLVTQPTVVPSPPILHTESDARCAAHAVKRQVPGFTCPARRSLQRRRIPHRPVGVVIIEREGVAHGVRVGRRFHEHPGSIVGGVSPDRECKGPDGPGRIDVAGYRSLSDLDGNSIPSGVGVGARRWASRQSESNPQQTFHHRTVGGGPPHVKDGRSADSP